MIFTRLLTRDTASLGTRLPEKSVGGFVAKQKQSHSSILLLISTETCNSTFLLYSTSCDSILDTKYFILAFDWNNVYRYDTCYQLAAHFVCGRLVLRLLCVFRNCIDALLCSCRQMKGCCRSGRDWGARSRRLLFVATMSSLAQLPVRDGY